ncbi:MAG: response regulator [Gammaproteobacteria bacterium]|nr:response regulator [Gammaproteobacteria bacterium]
MTIPLFGAKKKSLNRRVLLIVTLLTGALLSSAVALNIWREYQNQVDLLEQHGVELVRFLAEAISSPLWSMDTEAVNNTLRLVASDPDYVGIIIDELNGSQIVIGDTTTEGDLMHFTHAIIHHDSAYEHNTKIGDIELLLSTRQLQAFLYNKISADALLLLLLLFLNIVVIYRSLRLIRYPMEQLTESMRQFSDGNYQHSVYGLDRPDEIGVMAESLEVLRHHSSGREELKDQLIEANRSKDDFLASMSHELRTPLATIIGNCEILSEKSMESSEQKMIHAIEIAGRNQLALVDDILDMSKIDSGKYTLDETPYDLNVLLNELKMMLQIKAQDQGVSLTIALNTEMPFQLLGDGQRVGQILINLLGNAIKFTEHGAVELTVWNDANYLLFNVKDSGVGMSPETIDNLFGRFEQADGSISRRFGGSGLGLYISLNLAEMMGGEIDVSSREGTGSIFQLRLPFRPTSIPTVDNPTGTSHHSVLAEHFEGHVLVAEDTPELQLLERKILESMGITVTTVENGKEAVMEASANHFDLILMDMQMPEMDGIEATQTLRQQGVEIPIVPLTANVMQKHRDAFAAEGCDEFLAKPIDRKELRRVLNRYLIQEQRKLGGLSIINRREKERRAEERREEERRGAEEEVDDELMALFIDSSTKNRAQLTAALSSKAWPEVRAAAHSVKGSAASFGYPELSKKAETVQLAIDNERMEELPSLTMDLVIEMGKVLP